MKYLYNLKRILWSASCPLFVAKYISYSLGKGLNLEKKTNEVSGDRFDKKSSSDVSIKYTHHDDDDDSKERKQNRMRVSITVPSKL